MRGHWILLLIVAVVLAGCGFLSSTPPDDIYTRLITEQQQELDDYGETMTGVQKTANEASQKVAEVSQNWEKRFGESVDLLVEAAEKRTELEARVDKLEARLGQLEAFKKLFDKVKLPATKLPETRPAQVQMFLFVSNSCPSCPGYEAAIKKDLTPLGWKMGKGVDNHLQVVNTDIDPAAQTLWDIKVWPTILVVGPNGKEVGRLEGATDTTKLGEWLRGFQLRFP